MNGSAIIDALQLASGALWATVLLSRLPSVWRIVTDRSPSMLDFFAATLVGVAGMQMGFVLRWWLYPAAKRVMEPGELMLWACLYVTAALIALASHGLPRRG